jgi:hypothetical protein
MDLKLLWENLTLQFNIFPYSKKYKCTQGALWHPGSFFCFGSLGIPDFFSLGSGSIRPVDSNILKYTGKLQPISCKFEYS